MKISDTPSSRSANPGPAVVRSEDPATSPRPASDARRQWNASRLASMLNMAAPKDFTPGVNLTAPMLTLALHSPGFANGSGDTVIDVTGSTGEPVTTARTPDAMAWEMIRALGDGAVISLADATRALAIEDPSKLQNDPARIAKYFERVDTDRSGDLSHGELLKLLNYHLEHQDDDPKYGPKLPDTWV